MLISLIAAMSRNRVIGAAGKLPWHLPEDLKYFRKITSGHPVIMGRKTFESIGKLLPGRLNIIVTRNPEFHVSGQASLVSSLEQAFEQCRGLTPLPDEIFVIGGAEIYAQALKWADRLYLTLIDLDVEGDARFPECNESGEFAEKTREDHPATGSQPAFSFILLERV